MNWYKNLCLQVFKKVFGVLILPCTLPPATFPSSQPRQRFARKTKPIKFRLNVREGDLLETVCEAVVNPCTSNYDLNSKLIIK